MLFSIMSKKNNLLQTLKPTSLLVSSLLVALPLCLGIAFSFWAPCSLELFPELLAELLLDI
jgi:hypothetical protein